MSVPVFTAAELETGRQLFASNWDFAAAAGSFASLPPMQGVEIAFAGRSNVGKSSLINALTGRNALARTSRTPGRTQELIFFKGVSRLVLVDMPGYGFAKAPKDKVAAWTNLIRAYLKGRANLARVYVLVDGRHGLKPTDADVFETLDQAGLSYQIVMTKSDQVGASELTTHMSAAAAVLAKHPAAHPELLVTSSHTGAGVPEMRAAIARLLAERAD